jgi:hypothetical protein
VSDGWGPVDRPWWNHVADAVAGEPLAAAVLAVAALPLILGTAILTLGRRLSRQRRSRS